jgi:tetratricopeptide (TPR) repeat protein
MLSTENVEAIDIKAFASLIEDDAELPSDRVEGILLRHKSKSEALLRKILSSSSSSSSGEQSEEDHMEAFSLLTLILEAEGRYQEEEAEMKKMIEASKSVEHKALAHAAYGNLLENLGRSKEAMVHYGKSVELCPTEPQYLLDYVNLLYEKGQNNKAAKLVKRAISFLPPTDELRKYLKRTLIERGIK